MRCFYNLEDRAWLKRRYLSNKLLLQVFITLFLFLQGFSIRANNGPSLNEEAINNFFIDEYQLILTTPVNNMAFDPGTNSVLVQWQWEALVPSGNYSFVVEYLVNESSYTSEELSSAINSYIITPLNNGSRVSWRICSTLEDNSQVYSSWATFYVLRGSPIYVKPGAVGGGTSWTNAIDLQGALDMAIYGDDIWIVTGEYKPTQTTDRSEYFEIKEGVSLYGGFLGSELTLNERDWENNSTIISGDIGEEGLMSDNSYNVIRMNGTLEYPITEKSILNGLVIEGGYADVLSGNLERGAALLLSYASPLVVNCSFRNNYAENYGGAVFGNTSSSPHFYNTIFSENSVQTYGGAVFAGSPMQFVNCVFYSNQATSRGGAINGPEAPNNVYLYNSIVWANKSGSNPQLYNAIVGYSIVEGGYTGVSMLSSDPQFVDPDASDFRINSRSPALETGSNSFVPAWFVVDFSGENRIEGAQVDIGIYEGVTDVPFPSLPVEDHLFESTVNTVDLEWIWDATVPATIISYSVEIYINGVFENRVDDLIGFKYTLTGLSPIDRVTWRVAGVTNAGDILWSPWTNFSIKRDCPLYVKEGASGLGNSWDDATSIYDAFSMAAWGDEIWIATGTYKTTESTDRLVSFEIKDGIKVYGGFAGTESSVEERDIMANPTILSGEIGDPGILLDNSYHVVKALGTTSDPITGATIINGIILEKGYADINAGNNQYGGGIYMNSASPLVENVWIRNNYASYQGGGVYGDATSNPVFGNVIFSNNESGQNGGGVYSSASMLFYNCLWYKNYSGYWGGAAFASTNYTTLVYNSISWGNEALYNYNDFRYLLVKSSLVQDGSGISSLTGDPLFVDAEAGNFVLPIESPAYNSGNNLYVPSWLLTDFAGDQRIISDIVNMGPFEMEYIPNSSPTITDDAEDLVIWPNPVKTGQSITVMVGSEGLSSMFLMDVSGKTIMEKSDLGEESIVIRPVDFSPGVYIVLVECTNGSRVVGKLVVR